VRWNLNTDTPLPPDEPAGQNPPDGAIVNYYLKEAPPGPVTLEVLDDKGKLVRRLSSDDKPEAVDEKSLHIDAGWLRPPRVLPATAGPHRFVWDLHYPPPPGPKQYPLAAIYRDTPGEPLGPWVLPGQYVVRLTVGGKSQEQPLTVKMDPRVKTPPEGLERQFKLSMKRYEDMHLSHDVLGQVRKLRDNVKAAREKAKDKDLLESLDVLDRELAALEGARRRRGERLAEGPPEPSLARLASDSHHLLGVLQGADATPTTEAVAACDEAERSLRTLLQRWEKLTGEDIKALNQKLRKAELPLLVP
jgi:hypothetical protein